MDKLLEVVSNSRSDKKDYLGHCSGGGCFIRTWFHFHLKEGTKTDPKANLGRRRVFRFSPDRHSTAASQCTAAASQGAMSCIKRCFLCKRKPQTLTILNKMKSSLEHNRQKFAMSCALLYLTWCKHGMNGREFAYYGTPGALAVT